MVAPEIEFELTGTVFETPGTVFDMPGRVLLAPGIVLLFGPGCWGFREGLGEVPGDTDAGVPGVAVPGMVDPPGPPVVPPAPEA